MSAAQAEKWLGIRETKGGERFLRLALRREQESGRMFIIREGGEKLTRYVFTPEMIRRNLPELWEGRFQRTSRRIAETLDAIEKRIDRRVDERIENHPKIARLEEQQDEAMTLLEALAGHLRRSV